MGGLPERQWYLSLKVKLCTTALRSGSAQRAKKAQFNLKVQAHPPSETGGSAGIVKLVGTRAPAPRGLAGLCLDAIEVHYPVP